MRHPAAKLVEINGRIVAAARARVSVFDRGLLYGDGLFETLRAYQGRTFGLDAHLARLQESARFLGIALPRKAWRRDIDALLTRNRLRQADAWLRITVTRGAGLPGLLPPPRTRPTVIVSAGLLDATLARAQQRGVRVALLPYSRAGFLAEHKVLNYLPAVLGKVMAARHRSFEGLFVNADGCVTEGTTSNVFVWRRGRLWTPPIVDILPGLTRRLVIEAAVADGIQVRERRITTDDLIDADGAFLTSSLVEVVPIVAVGARAIGDGRPGRQTLHLLRLYRQSVDRELARR